jgi:hypothetical protein
MNSNGPAGRVTKSGAPAVEAALLRDRVARLRLAAASTAPPANVDPRAEDQADEAGQADHDGRPGTVGCEAGDHDERGENGTSPSGEQRVHTASLEAQAGDVDTNGDLVDELGRRAHELAELADRDSPIDLAEHLALVAAEVARAKSRPLRRGLGGYVGLAGIEVRR